MAGLLFFPDVEKKKPLRHFEEGCRVLWGWR